MRKLFEKDKQQILNIKQFLKEDFLSYKSIAKKCGTNIQFVGRLNNGEVFTYIGEYTYPIRQKHSAWRKFTAEQVFLIKEMYLKGYKQEVLARLYSVTQPCISYLLRNVSYQHLKRDIFKRILNDKYFSYRNEVYQRLEYRFDLRGKSLKVYYRCRKGKDRKEKFHRIYSKILRNICEKEFREYIELSSKAPYWYTLQENFVAIGEKYK
jgi:hypothetical protein